jgi:hypothetical protein
MINIVFILCYFEGDATATDHRYYYKLYFNKYY